MLTERSCDSLEIREDSVDRKARSAEAKAVAEAKSWAWSGGCVGDGWRCYGKRLLGGLRDVLANCLMPQEEEMRLFHKLF